MECLCLIARRAARTLTRIYDEALHPSGLTAMQFGLLSLLEARPGLTQAEIAERADSEQTTLSRGLKLLAANGWVRAERSGDDARKVGYHLTPRGAERRAEALPLWQSAQQRMRERLGKRFKKAVTLLQKVAEV
jgi:DNA-binding MarR family transcriptional regulator